MLNTRGLLAEATAANIFLVHGGRLSTPPVADGCLPGITRGVVMELAAVEERSLVPDAVLLADEAFLTNSLIEVTALVEVDSGVIGSGAPGPRTQSLKAAYREAVARECG